MRIHGTRGVASCSTNHEMIFKVIANHDGVQINHSRILVNPKNKSFRVMESYIHVNGADEGFEDIL